MAKKEKPEAIEDGALDVARGGVWGGAISKNPYISAKAGPSQTGAPGRPDPTLTDKDEGDGFLTFGEPIGT